jgi:hypothetical protein
MRRSKGEERTRGKRQEGYEDEEIGTFFPITHIKQNDATSRITKYPILQLN